MSIAEQILRAKADYDEVYNSAYEKGKAEGGDTETAYNEGVEAGKQAEYDRFWDSYQDNGKRVEYEHAFSGKCWNKDTFKPKYSMFPTSAYMMFRYNQANVDLVEYFKELGVTFDDSNNKNAAYMYFSSKFTRVGVVTLTNIKSTGDMFTSCYNLVTIDKIISVETVNYTNATFQSCEKLQNVTFEGVVGLSIAFPHSSKLTDTSQDSIITALKDYSGTTTSPTLTVHADVYNRMVELGKDALVTAKNWVLAKA